MDLSPLNPTFDELAAVADLLWQKGWAEANGGNVSVDVSELLKGDERLLLISTTGARFREMAKDPRANLILIAIPDEGFEYRVVWSETPDTRSTRAPSTSVETL